MCRPLLLNSLSNTVKVTKEKGSHQNHNSCFTDYRHFHLGFVWMRKWNIAADCCFRNCKRGGDTGKLLVCWWKGPLILSEKSSFHDNCYITWLCSVMILHPSHMNTWNNVAQIDLHCCWVEIITDIQQHIEKRQYPAFQTTQ